MTQSLNQTNNAMKPILFQKETSNGILDHTQHDYLNRNYSKDYKFISYFTNRNKSDLYSNNLSIREKYHTNAKRKRENVDNEEYGSKDLFENNKQDTKRMRSTCFNCGKGDHFVAQCPLTHQSLYNCYLCNQNDHFKSECPFTMCKKCHLNGHLASNCKIKMSKSNNCSNCKNYGHNAKECLINPIRNYLKKDGINCLFCNSKEHLICSFPNNGYIIEDYNSDNVNISDSQSDNTIKQCLHPNDFYSICLFFQKEIQNNKAKENGNHQLVNKKRLLSFSKVFHSIGNDEIQHTIFCELCGEMHMSSNCNKSQKNKSHLQSKSLYQVKNPLKFQPINPRTEFSINHHLPYKNYYEDDNSSGDSFREIVNHHLLKYKAK